MFCSCSHFKLQLISVEFLFEFNILSIEKQKWNLYYKFAPPKVKFFLSNLYCNINASFDSFCRLDGILLSYRHLRVLSKSASVAAETSGVVLEIQADFYVFRPEIGGVLQGNVIVMNVPV